MSPSKKSSLKKSSAEQKESDTKPIRKKRKKDSASAPMASAPTYSVPPIFEAFSPSLESGVWQEFWAAGREILGKLHAFQGTMVSPPVSSAPSQSLFIFEPEVVSETISKSTQKLLENPSKLERSQQDFFQRLQKLNASFLENLTTKNLPSFVEGERNDRRFNDKIWQEDMFFSWIRQSYLLSSQFMRDVVANIEGLDAKTHHKMRFYTQQFTDAMAPTNFIATNPVVLRETLKTKGGNLIKGMQNLLEDIQQGQGGFSITDQKAFALGQNLGATPGKVVFQNDLCQLIRYEPQTPQVGANPLLIISPWVNKYYIFDLQQENSFIRWILLSGVTVYIVSWINPDKRHARKTLSDYVVEGALEVFQVVAQQMPSPHSKINLLGYCSGGILLSCLLSYIKKNQSALIASVTVVATPIDFRQAGELGVYICEKQLYKLKSHLKKQGFLDSQSVATAFNLLRANELIWSSYIQQHLLGKKPSPFDLLYWSSDSTRLPARMHTYFLTKMYLKNHLIEKGKVRIKNRGVNLQRIKSPLMVVAALDDHIAPWRSAYPLTQLCGGPTRFILAGSGHTVGIFNHPSRKKYGYYTNEELPQHPDEWLQGAQKHPGSWWTPWRQWLELYRGELVPAQKIPFAHVVEEAPGSYALSCPQSQEKPQ